MKQASKAISKVAPTYMAMGSTGSGMGGMAMRLPENTLPMMGGEGQFGSLEMGGMFTVLKVRPGLAKEDYADRGPYKHPSGTVAYEWKGVVPADPVAAKPNAAHADYNVVDPRKHAMNHE